MATASVRTCRSARKTTAPVGLFDLRPTEVTPETVPEGYKTSTQLAELWVCSYVKASRHAEKLVREGKLDRIQVRRRGSLYPYYGVKQ